MSKIRGSQVRDESLTGADIEDGSIQRSELDTTTPGQAVVTKIVAGSGVTISETGVDPGTGDVTISAQTGNNDFGGFSPDYVFTPSQCIGGDAP